VVGIANNVHYGESAILSSIARLDELGVLHTGAGANLAAARAPVVVERAGIRYGFLQRSSVYWPTNHEAQKDAPGIAVIRGHTAYHVPVFKTRIGVPHPIGPALRRRSSPGPMRLFGLVPQRHCGAACPRGRAGGIVPLGARKEVLQYMKEIAHAAIDAGADIVVGHGPHYSLRSRSTGDGRSSMGSAASPSTPAMADGGTTTGRHDGAHRGPQGRRRIRDVQFVRHNDRNETYLCRLADEAEALGEITKASAAFGARLTPQGDRVRVELKG